MQYFVITINWGARVPSHERRKCQGSVIGALDEASFAVVEHDPEKERIRIQTFCLFKVCKMKLIDLFSILWKVVSCIAWWLRYGGV
jgi:hypothetical protein